MTTDPHDEHGEILRRALHAEAESVIPSDDGLERIRARIAAEGGRRHGFLGRFTSAGFGAGGLTVGWTRPVLAVAAAVAIAGFGVTAGPQTIDLIQHTVTGGGPSGGGGGDSDGDRTGAHPPPVVPGDPSSPAPTTPGAPSTSAEAGGPSSSPGLSSCVIPREGAAATTGTPSPGTTPAPGAPSGTPCPGGRTPTTSPSDPASTTPSPPDTSPEPSDKPTQSPTDTPSTTKQEQDAGQAAGP